MHRACARGLSLLASTISHNLCTYTAIHVRHDDETIISGLAVCIVGVQTLRTQDTSDSGHFGTSAEVSLRHFGTGAEMSGHFGTGAEVSLGHFGTSL